MSYNPNTPVSGDTILAEHITDIEDFIINLVPTVALPVNSYLYVGLAHSITVLTNYNLSGFYISVENTPTTGQAIFTINKNGSPLVTGVTLLSGTSFIDTPITGSVVKGDRIQYVVDSVDEVDVGFPINFGMY